jgi:hypothetical protein
VRAFTLLASLFFAGNVFAQGSVVVISQVLTPALFEVQSEDQGKFKVAVYGVGVPSECYENKSHMWSNAILKAGDKIELFEVSNASSESGVPYRQVVINYKNQRFNYAAVAIRSGILYAAPSVPELLVEQSQAQSEYRGVWRSCENPLSIFSKVSAESGIHPTVFYGIAMNESKWKGRPWPWTLNVAGRSYYFKDRETAYKAAEFLLSKKFTLFDIGLMQVNWKWNGHRFKDPWDALEPDTNIAAAADILLENFSKTKSMAKAIGAYHSKDPARAGPYVSRFSKHFHGVIAELNRTTQKMASNGEAIERL